MKGPKTIIMSGYGINCERETAYAFRRAGANPKVVHINELIDDKREVERRHLRKKKIPGKRLKENQKKPREQ